MKGKMFGRIPEIQKEYSPGISETEPMPVFSKA